jgi:pilus assembly protein Flp/PilA
MKRFAKNLLTANSGATAVEYGLILAVIAIASMVALHNFSGSAMRIWNDIQNQSTQAAG